MCHYIELLVQLNLYMWSLKNGHFGQVAVFMKRLAFLSRNLLQLMGLLNKTILNKLKVYSRVPK